MIICLRINSTSLSYLKNADVNETGLVSNKKFNNDQASTYTKATDRLSVEQHNGQNFFVLSNSFSHNKQIVRLKNRLTTSNNVRSSSSVTGKLFGTGRADLIKDKKWFVLNFDKFARRAALMNAPQ